MNAPLSSRKQVRFFGFMLVAASSASASCALIYHYSDYHDGSGGAGGPGGAGGAAASMSSSATGSMSSSASSSSASSSTAASSGSGMDAGTCAVTSDCGVSQNPCMELKCLNMACTAVPFQDGTPCNGSKFCYNGQCSQCATNSNCLALPCAIPTCAGGTCVVAQDNTACSPPAAGFCCSGSCCGQGICCGGGCCSTGVCCGSMCCMAGQVCCMQTMACIPSGSNCP